MYKYFFILGREPELSVAEIWQVMKDSNLIFKTLKLTDKYWIVETTNLLPSDFLKILGGTIKMGEIIALVPNDQTAIQTSVRQALPKDKRLLFGFSWYSHTPRWLNSFGLSLKQELSSASSYKMRFVVSREEVLSSVTIQKNHLLPPDGYELVFLPWEEQIFVGRTLLVQPYADYVARDFNRPGREARVGMLPPKLAHIMVNLAGGNKLDNILDPFCGAGTILQEAAILGVPQIYGADLSPASVKRSQVNWQWLTTKYPDIKSQIKIILCDVTELSGKLDSQLFSAIVCEPFLGPPQTGYENSNDRQRIVMDLTKSYSKWLRSLSSLLSPTGVIVMIWPVFKSASNYLFLPLLDCVKKVGLKIINSLPVEAESSWLSDRGTMIYERPDQKIAREVVILKKK